MLLKTERNEVDSQGGQCPVTPNWILALVAQTYMAVQSNKAAGQSLRFSGRSGVREA